MAFAVTKSASIKNWKRPMGRPSVWTDERLQVVLDRYVIAGETAAAVAADLGVSPSAIRSKVLARPDWARDAAHSKANHARAAAANIAIGREARGQTPKAAAPPPPPPPPPPPEPPPRPMPGPMLSLHNAPKRWRALEDPRPLDERILSALKVRPLSVMALASVIGAKEHAVDVQLAALAHAGGVEAGPAAECGRRNRLWRAAA